jgi:MFS family permease
MTQPRVTLTTPHQMASDLGPATEQARRHSARRGWIVVASAFTILFVTFGSANSFSTFFASMEQTFHASREAVSLIYSIAVPLYFLFGAISGPLADRFGARPACMAGALIGGLGLAYAAMADALWQVYLGFGLGAGLAIGFCYVPSVAAIQRWFVQRRGLASGIAVSGIGLSTMAMPLITQALIAQLGWRGAWLTMAASIVVIGGTAALFIDNSPERHGFLPDGGVVGDDDQAGLVTGDGISVREAVASRRFALLYLALISVSIGVYTVFVHLVPYSEDHGLSHMAAVAMLSLFGGGSIAGRFLLGTVADRLGRRRTLLGVFTGLALMQTWWLFAVTPWQIAIFAGAFGVCHGAYVALYPAFTADCFGRRNVSSVIGILYTASSIGTFLGPLLAGKAFDMFGSYALSIGTSAGFAVLAVIFVALTPEPNLALAQRKRVGTPERS